MKRIMIVIISCVWLILMFTACGSASDNVNNRSEIVGTWQIKATTNTDTNEPISIDYLKEAGAFDSDYDFVINIDENMNCTFSDGVQFNPDSSVKLTDNGDGSFKYKASDGVEWYIWTEKNTIDAVEGDVVLCSALEDRVVNGYYQKISDDTEQKTDLDLNNCTGSMVGGDQSKYHNTYLTLKKGRMEIGDYYYKDSATSESGITANYDISNMYYFDYKVKKSKMTITDEKGEKVSYSFKIKQSDDGRNMIVFEEAFLGFGTDWAMSNDDSEEEIDENPVFFEEENIHHSFDSLDIGSNSRESRDLSGTYTAFSNTVTYPDGVLNGSPPDYSRIALKIDGKDVYFDWYDMSFHGKLSSETAYRYGVEWSTPPLLIDDDTYEDTSLELDSEGDLKMTIDYNHNGTIVEDHIFFESD